MPCHGQSHGQSFLALAVNRFGGEGLYLLECAYDDLEAIHLTRGFLADPARYLRAARGPDAIPRSGRAPAGGRPARA